MKKSSFAKKKIKNQTKKIYGHTILDTSWPTISTTVLLTPKQNHKNGNLKKLGCFKTQYIFLFFCEPGLVVFFQESILAWL